ncbi:MAG: hypothetical protein IKC14_07130 [Kiritimatiellae bacterium]|nr:hypothetical protein [Kiritimatiellia bacterium]
MKKIVLGIVAVGGLSLSALAEEVELAQIDMSSFDASRFSAGATTNNNPKAYANRGPICAFNGSGLSNGKHVADTADAMMFMLSSNNEGNFPWYIQVDLGIKKRIAAFYRIKVEQN